MKTFTITFSSSDVAKLTSPQRFARFVVGFIILFLWLYLGNRLTNASLNCLVALASIAAFCGIYASPYVRIGLEVTRAARAADPELWPRWAFRVGKLFHREQD